MKLRLFPILGLIIIISCQSQPTKEITSVIDITYIENFTSGCKKIDSLEYLLGPNQYDFKINYKDQKSLKPVAEITYDVFFNMQFIDEKNYLIPSQINHSYMGYFSPIPFNKYSQNLIVKKNEKDQIEFDIEFCFQMLKKETKPLGKVGGNLTHQIKDAIKKLNNSVTLNELLILSNEIQGRLLGKNEFCRTFQISREENNIIVQNTLPRKEIIPREFIDSGSIEIIETGNMLDTLIVSQKVWDQKGWIIQD